MTRQTGRPVSPRHLSSRVIRARQINVAFIIAAIALIALVLAIPGFAYFQEVVARGQTTALQVEGETVSLHEFADRLAVRDRLLVAQFAGLGLGQGDPQMEQFLQQQRAILPEQVKQEAIENILVRQEVERRGITVTDETVDQTIQQEFASAVQQSTEPVPDPDASPGPAVEPEPVASPDAIQVAETYQRFLQQLGIDDPTYREMIRSDLYRRELTDQLRLQIPETAEQVRLRAAILPSEEEAQEVLEQVQAGQDLGALAAERSIDQRTKELEGQYDWMAKGSREASFEEVVFNAPVGLLPDVVPGLGGFAVIEVQEHDAARPLDPQQREELERLTFSRWVTERQEQAEIEDNLTPDNQLWALQRAERLNRQAATR